MSTHPIAGLIDHLASIRTLPAKVEHQVDPKQPCRVIYQITAATREAVQRVIDELCNKVGDGFGYATFVGPRRASAGWEALGQVVVYEASDAT